MLLRAALLSLVPAPGLHLEQHLAEYVLGQEAGDGHPTGQGSLERNQASRNTKPRTPEQRHPVLCAGRDAAWSAQTEEPQSSAGTQNTREAALFEQTT